MTIVRSIIVDDTTTEKVAENLQEEIRKIETEENARFISFASVGKGKRINLNPKGYWDLEFCTEIFMVAFSSNAL